MDAAGPDTTAERVGRFFDEKGDVLGDLMGGNVHFGYWLGPDDDSTFAEAADRLTDHMIDMLRPRPGDRVLDLGCGRGRPAVRLAQAAEVEVVGISVSRRDVAAATALARAEGVADRVTFRYADAMNPPFTAGSFDRVWAVESMLYMPDRLQVLRNIAALLRPGGRLALCDISETPPETAEDRAVLEGILREWEVHSLARFDDYPRLIAAAGLRLTDIVDVSDRTRYSPDRVVELFQRLVAGSGIPVESVDLPMELWDRSFAAFERMGYLIAAAERAG
ncbi:methyltransferase type 11 [Sphaerisporangium rufum]|uniref:Methyltransferase type 11 n=1 Tax=Sphaerisporangium rufum TaxID=1381558 RepID=A0A919R393_9ACTN|nr:methyltransferase type 11 [Sphaerisporangium rufum]